MTNVKSATAIAESLLEDIEALMGVEILAGFTPPLPNEYLEGLSLPYLRWMCQQLIAHPEWEADKANRWIGWVQCALHCQGYSSVDDERTRVRNLE